MVICPKCQTSLGPTNIAAASCNACGFRPSIAGVIPLFAPDYRLKFEDHSRYSIQNLITHAENHFWMISRRRVITDTVTSFLNEGKSFLEVGSGPGDVSKELQNRGLKVTVSDIQIDGLNHAANHNISDVVQFDLYHPIYRDHFDAVGAFDVIEHLEDDLTAAKHLLDIVKPGGFVFVTVPAHKWLWNNRDRLENHKRRYSRLGLRKLFEGVGATIISVDYIFFMILPLLLARTILDLFRRKQSFTPKDHENSMNINLTINQLLLKLTMIELSIFRRWSPPVGGTLILTAKKHNNI